MFGAAVGDPDNCRAAAVGFRRRVADQAAVHRAARGRLAVLQIEDERPAIGSRRFPLVPVADETRAVLVQAAAAGADERPPVLYVLRSEEHTSELQSLMRISYAVFCLKKKISMLDLDLYTLLLFITTRPRALISYVYITIQLYHSSPVSTDAFYRSN